MSAVPEALGFPEGIAPAWIKVDERVIGGSPEKGEFSVLDSRRGT